MKNLLGFALAGAAALLAAAETPVRAQPASGRPVTIVVPYPPGGVTDAMARLFGEKMQEALGQTVIVEDVAGGAGAIGVGRVARAAPDGLTLALGNIETNGTNAISQPLNFDVVKDFEPVALLPSYPFLIVSKNSLPAKTLPELIAWLRQNGEKAFQGTVGAGSIQHLCGLRMQKQLGVKWSFVPYRGGAAAMTELMAGQFDIMCTATGSFLPQVRAGGIRAYAVTAKARLEGAPEIPTVDEAGGLPGFHVSVWNAFFVPKGTPPAAIARLSEATNKTLADPALRKRIIDMGLEMPPAEINSPAALAAFHRAENDTWLPIMKKAMAGAEK